MSANISASIRAQGAIKNAGKVTTFLIIRTILDDAEGYQSAMPGFRQRVNRYCAKAIPTRRAAGASAIRAQIRQDGAWFRSNRISRTCRRITISRNSRPPRGATHARIEGRANCSVTY